LKSRVSHAALLVSAAIVASSVGPASSAPAGRADNVVVRWNAAALQGVRDGKLGPPMVSRALAIVHTCIYDAWAAYDKVALGTRFGAALRRPRGERNLRNIETAISFAAYRAAVDVFPGDKTAVFDPLMAALGYDPSDDSTDLGTPSGVGNVACGAVLDFRHHDGSNQLGDEPGGTAGVAYSDYTGYAPSNDPMDLRKPFDPATVRDPSRWQPLTYVDLTGAVVTPKFIGPFWDRVVPFALTSDDQLRSATGPARYGSRLYRRQARDLLRISARLTDEQKAITEYWADGPRSELPPGHWDLIAQEVSRRDHHGPGRRGIAADAMMFFAMTNAIFDAGIAAWDDKIAFDAVRPITAIRYLFRGRRVSAWAGPGKGAAVIDGAAWLPYQPSYFPTPPFAEYASGHSAFSAAGAEILKRVTGSDSFGGSTTIAAGSSKVEPGITPATDVTLRWRTFTDAANQAGLSRRYGGIHFEQGDLDGRAIGRACAIAAWEKAQTYFEGTAA
jgi:uncharacterized protein DUF6851/vanadium-dependent haloperoxidase-like protein